MAIHKRPRAAPPNPFVRIATSTIHVHALTVDDRLLMVRGFSSLKCLQALRVPDLQAAVRRAINQRLAALGDDPGDPL